METTFIALLGTSIAVGFIHTLVGVDHYLPFIALGAAERWSLKKSLSWTTLCGVAHLGSTLVLIAAAGLLGWAAGSSTSIPTVYQSILHRHLQY